MEKTLDVVRAALESKRVELLRSIRSQSSQLTIGEAEHDLIDRMQGMCSRDQAVTFLDALTTTLAQVNTAIQAIQDGSYGVCVECEQPISQRRLQVTPWASHCIRCQESREQRQHMGVDMATWPEAA
ncbi:MAG: TraR/DksA C4-type zinc finger protein [Bryobacteraceae bacterium]|nr:TraR/DksA C4-type zinc finger protein [Bryobacteraceae bacterium]